MKNRLFFSLALIATLACGSEAGNNIAQSENRIIHGSLVDPVEYKAVIYLATPDAVCSGVLVSQNLVLTAASCVSGLDPSEIGIYFTNEMGVDPSTVLRRVVNVYEHPDFDNAQFWLGNDLSFLELELPAPENVDPIPVLPSTLALSAADIGVTPVTFVGFGNIEGLNYENNAKRATTVTLDYVCTDAAGCTQDIDGIGYGMPSQSIGLEINNADSSYPGTCFGDGGGPALVTIGGETYVAGITTFGYMNDSDLCDFLTTAIKLDAFYDDFIIYYTLEDEDCNNGIDDNGDGDTDCDDFLCELHTGCAAVACDNTEPIACGESLTRTAEFGYYAYEFYDNNCTSGYALSGPEQAFALDVPAGTTVTATVTMGDSSNDHDLLLFKGSCSRDYCENSSMAGPGENESLSFVTDDESHFLIVDTYQNPGTFTIEITCDSTEVLLNEICDNEVDDDGDGFVDCDDNDCANYSACQVVEDPYEKCNNGRDDDGDGLIDCDDADCQGYSDCIERVEDCNNNIDDDGDFHIDCADADCAQSLLCKVTGYAICNNGIDDIGDGKIDCKDPFCRSSRYCPLPYEECGNYIDDDSDGLTDCEDVDCQSYAECGPVTGEICNNGMDDDADGLIDCADADCAHFSWCEYLKELPEDKSGGEDTGLFGCSSSSHRGSSSWPPALLLLLGLAFLRRKTPPWN